MLFSRIFFFILKKKKKNLFFFFRKKKKKDLLCFCRDNRNRNLPPQLADTTGLMFLTSTEKTFVIQRCNIVLCRSSTLESYDWGGKEFIIQIFCSQYFVKELKQKRLLCSHLTFLPYNRKKGVCLVMVCQILGEA